MNFKIGQKVAAIMDCRDSHYPCIFKKGEVFTITDMVDHPWGLGLLFAELALPPPSHGCVYHAFEASCFRPLVSRGVEMLDAVRINPEAPIAPSREDIRRKVDA